MSDGPSSLRQQWSILINSFIEEESSELKSAQEEKLLKLKSMNLTFADVESYSKELSQKRKSLNQQIEEIKQQIEEKNTVIETLQLVKSDIQDVVKEIEELNHQGEILSQELSKVDKKVKSLRQAEEILFSEDRSA